MIAFNGVRMLLATIPGFHVCLGTRLTWSLTRLMTFLGHTARSYRLSTAATLQPQDSASGIPRVAPFWSRWLHLVYQAFHVQTCQLRGNDVSGRVRLLPSTWHMVDMLRSIRFPCYLWNARKNFGLWFTTAGMFFFNLFCFCDLFSVCLEPGDGAILRESPDN